MVEMIIKLRILSDCKKIKNVNLICKIRSEKLMTDKIIVSNKKTKTDLIFIL